MRERGRAFPKLREIKDKKILIKKLLNFLKSESI